MFSDMLDLQPQSRDRLASKFGEAAGPIGRSARGGGLLGGGGIPPGRRLGSSDLQLLLLLLLAEAPAHGYELIRTLEERSDGFYSPSPGMVYPALTKLEESGHASIEAVANRKLYSITAAGRERFEADRERATLMLATLQRIGARMAEVREAYAGTDDFDPQSIDELSLARYALKQAMRNRRDRSPEATQRITRILKNAADEISKI